MQIYCFCGKLNSRGGILKRDNLSPFDSLLHEGVVFHSKNLCECKGTTFFSNTQENM